jgi:hypothetical protein
MRDMFELFWLRITLLPKVVVIGVVSTVVIGVIGGGAALYLSTVNVTPGVVSINPAGEAGTGGAREATAKEIDALVAKVVEETDPGRAVRVANTAVKYDDVLTFSCERVLQAVGAALYEKFGASAVGGDSSLCAGNLVVGATLAAFKSEGASVSTAQTIDRACVNAIDRPGCQNGVVAAIAQELGASDALSYCKSADDAVSCASNAVRPLLSNRVEPMPISVCATLPTGDVKNGCALAFGTRYAGVEETLTVCAEKLQGAALVKCEFGYATLLADPPAGLTATSAMFNQCAVAKSCPEVYAQVQRDRGRTVEQVTELCLNFEALTAREACTEWIPRTVPTNR